MVIKAKAQPFIVFGALAVPIVGILILAAWKAARLSDWIVPSALILMFATIFIYLSSLRLALSEDEIIYRALFKKVSISIKDVIAIEHRRGPFGIGSLLVIRAQAKAPLVANASNFNPHEVRKLLAAVTIKNDAVRVE